MTRQQFLSGVHFTLGSARRGASTYNYDGSETVGHISRQIRSAVDKRIVLDDYECNVSKLGRVGFTGITFVMGKKVLVKHRFADLVIFEEGV
jgi:hypothetical protein